ncbi:hypothetical protein SAMN05444483_104306 [Salegentibacter echinorum]|uniref:Uncharacterized protein n=1 Tax=Salegentibacter echinorum TaxID=1073325 RepID=A0A1M5GTT4_SALEC|nr:hypothetical protein [Salegentibacter echinorum]SHG07078.1 hypothetical protein SAMN05444483_104306 [Salegentibacter echinorum]
MKKILIFALLIITVLFSYLVSWSEWLLLTVLFLGLVFLIILGLIRIFRKSKKILFQSAILLIGICLIGIFAGLFRPYEPALLKSGTISEQLEYAYKTDQSDRKQLRSFIPMFSKLQERDVLRLEKVKQINAEGELTKSRDKFHSAFIYHHSDNSADYKMASKLAAAAAKDEGLQNDYQVQWLRKAAYDRWMVSQEKPEKYNTQNKFSIEIK